MERNTATTIYDLQPGDRFYKANDKKKDVWEKVEHTMKQTNYQTYSHFAKREEDKYALAFKSNTQVIFLRNNNQ
jgi:L-rhamnose mutarotase